MSYKHEREMFMRLKTCVAGRAPVPMTGGVTGKDVDEEPRVRNYRRGRMACETRTSPYMETAGSDRLPLVHHQRRQLWGVPAIERTLSTRGR